VSANHTAQSSELTASSTDHTQSPLDLESFDDVAFFSLEKVVLSTIALSLRHLFGSCYYCLLFIIVLVISVLLYLSHTLCQLVF